MVFVDERKVAAAKLFTLYSTRTVVIKQSESKSGRLDYQVWIANGHAGNVLSTPNEGC